MASSIPVKKEYIILNIDAKVKILNRLSRGESGHP